MIHRILLSVFVAWFAITPAIAGACAAECAKANGELVQHQLEQHSKAERQPAVPDCHQANNDNDDSRDPDSPNTAAMAVACLVAATVGAPASLLLPAAIDVSTEHDALVLLPFVSFQASPPYKPPRA